METLEWFRESRWVKCQGLTDSHTTLRDPIGSNLRECVNESDVVTLGLSERSWFVGSTFEYVKNTPSLSAVVLALISLVFSIFVFSGN